MKARLVRESLKLMEAEKDKTRVLGIVDRANGIVSKETQLAQNMANAITTINKAIERARAAKDLNKDNIAKVFFNRILELDPDGTQIESYEDLSSVYGAPKQSSVNKDLSSENKKLPTENIDKEIKAPEIDTTPKTKEIDVRSIPYKETPNHKKLFFADRYNLVRLNPNATDYTDKYARLNDDEIEILKKVFGENQTLWRIVRKNRIKSIQQKELESDWENKTPGYVGRMSGDLIVAYKATVEILDGPVYFREYTVRHDTRGFW